MPAPIIFPPALPRPSSTSLNPVEQRSASTLDGPTRLRGRGFEVATKADVSWDLTQAQHDVFVSWYEIELGLGRRRFLLPLLGDGGTRVRLCVFVSSLKTAPIAGNAGWTVSASVEFTEAVQLL